MHERKQSNMDEIKGSPPNMSTLKCACIITAAQMGTAVLTLPGVISELGLISFLMNLFCLGAINLYCATIAIFAFDKVLKEKKTPENDDELQRQPLQVYCKHAFGEKSSLVTLVIAIQLLSHLTLAIILILISAVTLKDLANLQMNISSTNETRVWIVVVFFIILFPAMINSYRELGYIGLIAVLSIIIAVVAVLISSIYIALSPISIDTQRVNTLRREQVWFDYSAGQILFSTFGTINLTFCSYMPTLPNLSVILLDSHSLIKSTFLSSILIYIVYIIAGCIPYFLLQKYVIDASAVTTILRVSNEYDNGILLALMTKSVGLLAAIHFFMATTVTLNPIHLRAEKYFQVPSEFSMKRLVVRGSILFGLTLITLIFPMLSQIISWLGGGILMVYGLLVPMALYLKLCETTLWTKIFCCILTTFNVTMIIGVNVVEIHELF